MQSIRIPGDLQQLSESDALPRLASLWSQAEALKKSGGAEEILAEQKLKCVFLGVAEVPAR